MKSKFILLTIPLIILLSCSNKNEQDKNDSKPTSEIDSLETLREIKSTEIDSLKNELEMLRNKRDSLKSVSN